MVDVALREDGRPSNGLPDPQHLARVLADLLASRGYEVARLEVIDRARSLHGTHPKEIVTCQLENGLPLRFFCKYGEKRGVAESPHRGGVAYEAAVYERILEQLAVSVPPLIGVYHEPSDGRLWLVQEYLGDNLRILHSEDPEALPRAARWLGAFHLAASRRLALAKDEFLIRYDSSYYRRWVEGTLATTASLSTECPWLPSLCERFIDAIEGLTTTGPTIVHGEFYPKNILYLHGTVYPVDWESAAIGAGAVDLAALTEGWSRSDVVRCRRAYELARWPEGSPADFGARLSAARLYLHLRWLGDPSTANGGEVRRRLARLKSFADGERNR